MIRPEHLAILGLVRNGAGKITADVLRLQKAVQGFATVHWLLVESDSTDESVSELNDLCSQIENFRFISKGSLRERFPRRTDRIAFCRNAYVDELRTNPIYEKIEIVIVADFDGINSLISEEAIRSCWDRSDWAVCAANQAGPYYDIFALRHSVWCPNHCIDSYRFLITFGIDPERALQAAVLTKMIRIPENGPWIEVDSAFGGLALYKREFFKLGRYIGLAKDGSEICEHVHFHSQIRAAGGTIFINPNLINTALTEHTLPLKLRYKLVRLLKNMSRRAISWLAKPRTS